MLEKKYTYGAEHNNMIIRGDNLEALKALLPKYESKVECIYLNPPYNTAHRIEKCQQWMMRWNLFMQTEVYTVRRCQNGATRVIFGNAAVSS